jgi:hypothetical protein
MKNSISKYLKVSTKKVKWSKVKAKSVEYFKTISIPGIPQIVTTESYLLKMLWTVVILCVFVVGFYIISQAIADFYKYDKITNIERVNPEIVTYPAITICALEGYLKEHYINGSNIKNESVSFTDRNLLKQFVNVEDTFFSKNNINQTFIDVKNHIDFFKIAHPVKGQFLDCLRFNAITNRSVELFKANSIEDHFRIVLNDLYRENITKDEYYRYFMFPFFFVYVGDNSLNSFENLQYLGLRTGFHNIEIEKVSIETKLPEPFNPCKKSSVDKPYHQMDCIEACTYKEIKNKYNCTFHLTLFSIQGLRSCPVFFNYYRVMKDEFSARCLKECPLESCFTEKLTFDFTSTPIKVFESIAVFEFYFREFSTLNITQIPKTDQYTFLNNIGGGLGLFMGIAFPNLIEFFQFILEIILIIFIRKIH